MHDLTSAGRVIRERRVDVVVVDLELDGESGMDLLRAFREEMPATLFVLLTDSIRPETITEALVVGASAVIGKDRSLDDLLCAIREADLGRTTILVEGDFDAPLMRMFRLTKRELGILDLISQGQANREIAASLFLRTRIFWTSAIVGGSSCGLRAFGGVAFAATLIVIRVTFWRVASN